MPPISKHIVNFQFIIRKRLPQFPQSPLFDFFVWLNACTYWKCNLGLFCCFSAFLATLFFWLGFFYSVSCCWVVAIHNNFQQVAQFIAFCHLSRVWVAVWLCRLWQAALRTADSVTSWKSNLGAFFAFLLFLAQVFVLLQTQFNNILKPAKTNHNHPQLKKTWTLKLLSLDYTPLYKEPNGSGASGGHAMTWCKRVTTPQILLFLKWCISGHATFIFNNLSKEHLCL